MGQAKFNKTVQAIRGLSRKDWKRLRDILDAWLKPPGEPLTEKEITYQLLRDGIVDQVAKEMDVAAYERYQPVEVQGKPVSETIIEERR